MTTIEYLKAILASQDLKDDSQELKDLNDRRAHVEDILRKAFPKCSPTIRYGGSRAKGTLIKEQYDLDIVCYFPNDDTTAGETLEDIFNNVAKALEGEYFVFKKTSALRLQSKEHVDFHIDVVPGRFTDDTKTDCFLHQNQGDKARLKTNLDVHIQHVRGSKVLEAIRLLKLWKTRRALGVKQFAFELLTIELLASFKEKTLDAQLIEVFTKLRDLAEPITVEDPANPTGNDLTPMLSTSWFQLSAAATATLVLIEERGWEAVFGKVETEEVKTEDFRRAAAVVSAPSRPWAK
jgi:hypothetical protein